MDAPAREPPPTLPEGCPRPATPLVARAEQVFDSLSPYDGDGFRNHCRRLYTFTTLLMEREDLAFDGDLAYLVAMLHDLGIVSEQDEGHTYLQRSRALLDRVTADLALPEIAPDILDECMIHNHRVFPVPNMSPEAECFRRAVWIEHSRGLRTYGLGRSVTRTVFRRYPRGNFDAVLADFTRRTIRREPLTLVNGIFL